MTGVAKVTSEVAFDALQIQFLERLGSLKTTQVSKSAWQNVCVCKAAIEITAGDKKHMTDIKREMFIKYKKWVTLLIDNKDPVVIGKLPLYVTEKMLITIDVGEKKLYSHPKAGESMWKRWLRVRREIRDRDNHAIKKAIARMPGCALPSGTDFALFLDRVIYELYVAKEKERVKPYNLDDKVDNAEGSDDEDNAQDSDIGGSAAKVAGRNSFMLADCSKEAMGNCSGDSIDNDIISVHEKQLMTGEEESSERKADSMHDNEKEEDHDEPKAPATFVPANLLVILITGVLLKACDPSIAHVCELAGETKLTKVPTRIDIRLAGLNDGLLTTSKGTSVTRPDAISLLKRQTDFNEVYKEAAQAKDDLGQKRLKIDEELSKAQMETMKKEASSREKEVAAREKEVAARAKETQASALEQMYKDLREELKEANEDGDKDEIERVKKELADIKKMRVNLLTNKD